MEGTKVTIFLPSPSVAPPTEQVNGELVKEAVQLLRSLRPRTKAVKVSSMREGSGERALQTLELTSPGSPGFEAPLHLLRHCGTAQLKLHRDLHAPRVS